jgi:hypothetical protein
MELQQKQKDLLKRCDGVSEELKSELEERPTLIAQRVELVQNIDALLNCKRKNDTKIEKMLQKQKELKKARLLSDADVLQRLLAVWKGQSATVTNNHRTLLNLHRADLTLLLAPPDHVSCPRRFV